MRERINITRRRWFNAAVIVLLLAGAAYNLDMVNCFRTYSLDALVLNKLERDEGISALMYTDQPSKFQDDPGEIRKLINSFKNVKLREVKYFERNKTDMGDYYLAQTINYHTRSYALQLYGDGKTVEHLEINDSTKKKDRLTYYKIIGGSIDYAAIREVVDNSLAVDGKTAK